MNNEDKGEKMKKLETAEEIKRVIDVLRNLEQDIGNMRNLEKSGDQRDIVPTILTEMGVDISKLRPKYTGTVLTAH